MLNFFTQVSEEDFPDRPELRPVRRKLLEKALDYYKDFIAEQGDDPSVQDELTPAVIARRFASRRYGRTSRIGAGDLRVKSAPRFEGLPPGGPPHHHKDDASAARRPRRPPFEGTSRVSGSHRVC